MRSHAICIAMLLILSGAAAGAQPSVSAASSTCAKTPRAGGAQASAQLIAAHHAMKRACAADMAKYCADVPKGCGAPRKCLRQHESELSQSCSSAWQNMRSVKNNGA